MKMKWISRIRSPYGGILYWVDPISKAEVKGTTYEMLMANAIAERKANGIPIGLEFEAEVEEALCRDYPQECMGADPRMPRARTLDFDTVLRGTKVLLAVAVEQAKHLLGLAESPLVEQTSADYRAMTCAKCEMNRSYQQGCTRCQDILKLVRQIKGTRSTPYDSQLKACQICGCSTEAHVWVRLDLLAKGVDDEMRAKFKVMGDLAHCWKQT